MNLARAKAVRWLGGAALLLAGVITVMVMNERATIKDLGHSLIGVKGTFAAKTANASPFRKLLFTFWRVAGGSPISKMVGNITNSWNVSAVFSTCSDISGTEFFIDRKLHAGQMTICQAVAPCFATTNVVSAKTWYRTLTNAIQQGAVQAEWFDSSMNQHRTSNVVLIHLDRRTVVVVPPERVQQFEAKNQLARD